MHCTTVVIVMLDVIIVYLVDVASTVLDFPPNISKRKNFALPLLFHPIFQLFSYSSRHRHADEISRGSLWLPSFSAEVWLISSLEAFYYSRNSHECFIVLVIIILFYQVTWFIMPYSIKMYEMVKFGSTVQAAHSTGAWLRESGWVGRRERDQVRYCVMKLPTKKFRTLMNPLDKKAHCAFPVMVLFFFFVSDGLLDETTDCIDGL